jgi:hypothetical protein
MQLFELNLKMDNSIKIYRIIHRQQLLQFQFYHYF